MQCIDVVEVDLKFAAVVLPALLLNGRRKDWEPSRAVARMLLVVTYYVHSKLFMGANFSRFDSS